MEPDILQTITLTSFAPAVFLFIWRVVLPWSNTLLARMNGTDKNTYEKLCKIEGNDLHEIRGDIIELGRRMLTVETDMKKMSDDIATLMERTRK